MMFEMSEKWFQILLSRDATRRGFCGQNFSFLEAKIMLQSTLSGSYHGKIHTGSNQYSMQIL